MSPISWVMVVTTLGFTLAQSAFAASPSKLMFGNGACRVSEEDAYPQRLGPFRDAFAQDMYLNVDFPGGAKWRFGLRNDLLKGLGLVDVSVQAGQFMQMQTILKRAGITEIFVPYHKGANGILVEDLQLYDMRFGGDVTHLDEIEPADLSADLSSVAYLRTPVGGQYTRETVPRVGVECRDTGLAWLCKEPLKHIRARMHEVSVWAVFDGGNYDNIIEYVFREDGSMGFRYGVTGFVHPGVPQVAHMHNSLWRVSTSLFGRTDNAVFQSHHLKLGDLTADDTETPVSNETSINLAPTEFTSLIVRSSSKKNARGNPMGYEFVPWNRLGTARQSSNPSDQQLWTLSDFHVTNDRPGEDGTGTAPNNWRFSSGWRSPDEYLLKYTKRNSPVPSNNDSIAIWYNAAVHHEPSDLDNQKLLSAPIYSGVTPIHRSGFDLMPHNFFDFNPIGGPAACHVP